MRPRHTIVISAVVALVLAGCGGASTTPTDDAPTSAPVTVAPVTPAPTAEPTASPTAEASTGSGAGRTGRIEVPEEGFALTLPDGWVEISVSGEDFDTIMGAFPDGTFNEEFQAAIKAAVEGGVKLWGFDTLGDGSNVNVLVQDSAAPLSMLKPLVPAQLEQVPGVSNIQVDLGTVNGQEAIVATYESSNELAAGGTSEMTGTQAYLASDTKLYIVTVSLAKGSSVDAAALLETIELLP